MDILSECRLRIENAIHTILPDSVGSDWMSKVAGIKYRSINMVQIDEFLEPGRVLIKRGGKRWRPLIAVLTCQALGGGKKADILSTLVEIPHNGSLIIDDIEDGSVKRRGGNAIHVDFGEDMAINAGNFMYFLPTVVFDHHTIDARIALEVSKDWMTVMRHLHIGQGYDILWHKNRDCFPDVDAYLSMCQFKTGSLPAFAARTGVRAAFSGHQNSAYTLLEKVGLPAGSQDILVDMLGLAWEEIGTGFQILDDASNLTSGVPGKNRGDDIVEGKKSLPVIYHVESNPQDKSHLIRIFESAAQSMATGNHEPVQEAIRLMEDSGAIRKAREHGGRLLDSGRKKLQSLLPESMEKTLLIDMLDEFQKKML